MVTLKLEHGHQNIINHLGPKMMYLFDQGLTMGSEDGVHIRLRVRHDV